MTRKVLCEFDCSKYTECRKCHGTYENHCSKLNAKDYDPHLMYCSAGPCVTYEEYLEIMEENRKYILEKKYA